MGDPPGGPPDVAPPSIVTVRPESGAVAPDWKDDAVIQFDEVIDEMAGSSGGGGIAGIGRQIVLSPVQGDVRVSWGRTRITVKPKEGWKAGRVYHLELLPGIVDLRRNTLKTGRLIIFSTGPAIGHASLTGTALQWVEQRTLVGALIEAVPGSDSVGYLTVSDSAGHFHIDALSAGTYTVYATADQNNNRRRDRREAYDSAVVTVDSTASVALFTFVHDTTGPRLRLATALDSVTVRLEFSQPLAPGTPLDSARVRVLQLPDSTPVTIGEIFTPRQYDSVTAAERKAARPDSAARGDSAAPAAGAPLAAAQRAPAARGAPPAAAAQDTAAARADTAEVRRLLAARPVPFDKAVLRFPRALAPETRYFIRVRGAVNLNGATGDGQVTVVTPKPPAAKADTTNVPRPAAPPRPPKR